MKEPEYEIRVGYAKCGCAVAVVAVDKTNPWQTASAIQQMKKDRLRVEIANGDDWRVNFGCKCKAKKPKRVPLMKQVREAMMRDGE